MGNILLLFKNFFFQNDHELKDAAEKVIQDNENLKWAEDQTTPYWKKAKNIKNEWKKLETDQQGKDRYDEHHWGPEHILERGEDLVEDWGIEEVNELGVVDMVDDTI